MKHLNEVKENYVKHFGEATLISLSLLVASIACFIHAFIPIFFNKTASTIMRKILSRTDQRYDR